MKRRISKYGLAPGHFKRLIALRMAFPATPVTVRGKVVSAMGDSDRRGISMREEK
jgi:hypothetical protein